MLETTPVTFSRPATSTTFKALGPQPHTILVAPGGKIVYRHNGKVDEDELLTAIL